MDSPFYSNPYTGSTFFDFFYILATRLVTFIQGKLPLDQIASDEIQILVLLGVATSTALVGTFLVLRKSTMLANSLSHTILLGIVIAFVFTHRGFVGHHHIDSLNVATMLFASLIMGILTTFFTELLTKGAHLQEDASIGIIFTSFFAVGIIAVTMLTRCAHIGTEVVMGNVDALQPVDCQLVYAILIGNLLLFFLFFKEFKITTFDAGLSRAFGISPTVFNYLLMIQVSATAIGAFRAVGVLMVLAFIAGPPLTARLLACDLGSMLWLAVLLGCVASLFGVALSRHFLTVYDASLSTAGIVVCAISFLYVAVALYATRHRWVNLWSPSRNERLLRPADLHSNLED